MPDAGASTRESVLIISADPAERAALRHALREVECEVAEAATCEETVEAVSRVRPSVVVLGAGLPAGSSLEACRQVKAKSAAPVVAVLPARTSGGEKNPVDRALQQGADAFVTAPVDDRVLVAVVESLRRARRAEAERALLADVLEQMPALVLVAAAPSGEAIYVNEEAHRLTGVSVGEITHVGRVGALRAFHLDGREYDAEEWPGRRAVRGETVTDEEMHLLRPDGSRVTILANATAIRNHAGELVAGVVVVQDVTHARAAERERERLLAELDEQRRFLQAVVDNAPEAIMVTDERARVILVNRVAQETLVRPIPREGDIERHAEVRLCYPDGTPCPPHDLPLMRAALYGESVRGKEMGTILPDGTWRPMLGNVAPVRDASGAIIGAVVIFQDITEQKRAEQEAARLLEVERQRGQQARLLEAIQEAVGHAVAYLDRGLRIFSVNSTAERALGRTRHELIGQSAEELFPDCADLFPLLYQVLTTGEPIEIPELLHTIPGRPELAPRCYNLSLHPVRNEQGEVEGLVLSAVNVTEQVEQREQRLAAERARAELAESMSSEISHRVKNNLMMVTGLLQMQAAGQSHPEVALALKDTLTRLFAFASIHEQLQSTGTNEVDLLDAARRIAEVNRRVFTGRSLEVSVAGSHVYFGARLAANLSVVLNELVTNAVKHGAPGEDGILRISVNVATEGGALSIAVWNSGDTLPEGFDLGQQESMGLRLVRDVIAGQSGGTFSLTRHEGGTLARIVVPEAALR